MVDDTPSEPLPLLPGCRLVEAGTRELERVLEALAPIRLPAVTKPTAEDPMKARVRAGLGELCRGA